MWLRCSVGLVHEPPQVDVRARLKIKLVDRTTRLSPSTQFDADRPIAQKTSVDFACEPGAVRPRAVLVETPARQLMFAQSGNRIDDGGAWLCRTDVPVHLHGACIHHEPGTLPQPGCLKAYLPV